MLDVWETSCPGLLKSKKKELALQTEGTPEWLEVLTQQKRINLVYDSVAALKNIEVTRPIVLAGWALRVR